MKCAMAVPEAENQTCQERLAAGNHRYSVGTETARFRATSRGGIPPASNCLADSIFPVVILRGRPPIRPSFLAAPSPARVRSTISSRSICARLAMTWKKNRPAGVLVSIPSVRARHKISVSNVSDIGTYCIVPFSVERVGMNIDPCDLLRHLGPWRIGVGIELCPDL